MNDRLLEDKVIIITGVGHGIGKTAAIEMARQGATLQLSNRSADNGNATLEEVRAAGGTAELTISDVADPDGSQQIIDDCIENFGRVDVLYANAGFIRPRAFEEMTEDDFDAVLGVHVHGAVACTRAALPHMIERRSGKILLTGTPAAYSHAPPWQLNYAAAKGAVTAFMRCLYKEVYEYGITVNCIVPNGPTTRRGPEELARIISATVRWGRFGLAPMPAEPPSLDRIAATLAYVASDEVADITGRTIFIGGSKIGLYTDPELEKLLANPGGWDYESLRAKFRSVVPAGLKSPFFGDDPELVKRGGAFGG